MRVVILGAGGFGTEVLDAALAAGLDVRAFAEPTAGGDIDGTPVVDEASALAGSDALVIGIADPAVRRRVADAAARATWISVVHPGAGLGTNVGIADGAVVLSHAYLSRNVALAEHAQVHYGATIGHDTTIGACSTVLPGANVAGRVSVGAGVLVGSGAVILQGLRIGDGATVGAGAVVTKDVASGQTVVGVPARPMVR